MGRIAIFVAASAGWALLAPEGALRWIWVGIATQFVLGFWEDRRGVPPLGKLAVQLGGAALLIWVGLTLVPGWPAWFSILMTVF
jgi:UDP-N-acetylmuramyl pentapeptide phosphotransferase/UDP-N-acetylglucosamine-1-phosphate transferase